MIYIIIYVTCNVIRIRPEVLHFYGLYVARDFIDLCATFAKLLAVTRYNGERK